MNDSTDKEKSPFLSFADRNDPVSDIAGLVAYGIYKYHKREWIKKQVDIKGRNLSRAEADQFSENITLPQIKQIKEDARRALKSFADEVLKSESPGIVDAAIGELQKEIIELFQLADQNASSNSDELLYKMDELKVIQKESDFWRDVWVGVVSAFFWTIFIIIAGLITAYVRPDIIEMIEKGALALRFVRGG